MHNGGSIPVHLGTMNNLAGIPKQQLSGYGSLSNNAHLL